MSQPLTPDYTRFDSIKQHVNASTDAAETQITNFPKSSRRLSPKKSIRCLNQQREHWDQQKSTSVSEPPPLSKAIRTALAQELLQVPSKAFETSLRRKSGRSRSSTKLSSPSLPWSADRVPTLGSLEQADINSASLCPKLLLISEDSCILLYSITGSPDRLPEKVLQLEPSTIAVASDALPGRHWVLNIVRDARPSDNQRSFSLRGLRPRLLSRHSERKLHPQELYLIFETPFSFDRWLVTVRKEIEALGGLEYRPDSRGLNGLLTVSPADSDGHSIHFPSAPFVFPLTGQDIQSHRPQSSSNSQSSLPRRSPAPSLHRESATDSSVASVTELDGLRDSLVSESSIPGTRSSYAESLTAARSPVSPPSTVQAEAPVKVVNTTFNVESRSNVPRKKAAPPAISVGGGGVRRERSVSCSPALPSPSFPRTPTLPTDMLHSMAGKFAPSVAHEIHSPVEAAKMADWLESLTRDGGPRRSEDTPTPTQALPTDESHNGPELNQHMPEEVAPLGASYGAPRSIIPPLMTSLETAGLQIEDEQTQAAPPPYSLAPARRSSVDALQKPLRSPRAASSISRAASANVNLTALPLREADNLHLRRLSENGPGTTRKTVHKHLSVVTKHDQLAIDHAHKTERSPAVDATHIATCFGVDKPFGKQSISIGGEFLDFPTTGRALDFPPSPTLQQALDLPFRTPTMSRQSKHHLGRQQSLPNIAYRAQAPISPPPSAPLPAVPDHLLAQSTAPTAHSRWKSMSSKSAGLAIDGSGGRRRRSTCTKASLSPLSSNPVSTAEVKYARRLSASLGMGPANTIKHTAAIATETRGTDQATK